MTQYEQKYSRAPCAKFFNSIGCWDSQANLTVIKGGGIESSGHYEAGRPDGLVSLPLIENLPPLSIAVECKAFLGSLYFGNPTDQDGTSGWHYHQREWYKYRCIPINRPYYIWLWLYPDRIPERIYQAEASVYLVPAQAWLDYERLLEGRMSIGMNEKFERELKYKPLTVDKIWQAYALEHIGTSFRVPRKHAIFNYTGYPFIYLPY